MQGPSLAALEPLTFAEIAKKVQTETLELMLPAGKDVSEDTTAASRNQESHCNQRLIGPRHLIKRPWRA